MERSTIWNQLLAGFAGALAATATGFALFPIVMIVGSTLWEYDVKSFAVGWLTVTMMLAGWFFLAAYVGGFVCGTINKTENKIAAFFPAAIASLVLFYLVFGDTSSWDDFRFSEIATFVVAIAAIWFGFFRGNRRGILARREKNQSK